MRHGTRVFVRVERVRCRCYDRSRAKRSQAIHTLFPEADSDACALIGVHQALMVHLTFHRTKHPKLSPAQGTARDGECEPDDETFS